LKSVLSVTATTAARGQALEVPETEPAQELLARTLTRAASSGRTLASLAMAREVPHALALTLSVTLALALAPALTLAPALALALAMTLTLSLTLSLAMTLPGLDQHDLAFTRARGLSGLSDPDRTVRLGCRRDGQDRERRQHQAGDLPLHLEAPFGNAIRLTMRQRESKRRAAWVFRHPPRNRESQATVLAQPLRGAAHDLHTSSPRIVCRS